MGAFNSVDADVVCPVCNKLVRWEIQFKYGNTWQYAYRVGDRLRWGGNDIGVPGRKEVRVEGIGGTCPCCSAEGIEFDVMVRSDVIVDVVSVGKDRPVASDAGFVVVEE